MAKGELVLFLNGNRTPFFDFIFLNATQLGDALIVLFLLPLVFFFRLRWLLIFISGFLVQVFLVLLFKKGLLTGELRPYLYYKYAGQLELLNLVPGLKMRHIHTFPSGHTATIFFIASFFSLLSRNSIMGWLLAGIALLVGISRVYLAQHFYPDVYFGMLFGVLSSVLAYLWVIGRPRSWHKKKIDFSRFFWKARSVDISS